MNEQINSMGTKQYCVLTNDLLVLFFKEYLISKNTFYHLESEGFNLVKSLFKIINEKEHKIQILNCTQAKKDHGTVSSASGATLTSSTYSSVQNSKEFIIYCHPRELVGIDTFWKIIMECTDIDVIAECIIFVDNIYHNISDLIESQRIEIEEDLVKTCISKIDELLAIYRKQPTEDPSQDKNVLKLAQFRKEYAIKQIQRFFFNIRSFMENSETHGIGDILTQSSLNFDEKLTIVVNNRISYGQGCYNKKGNPKKFRLRVAASFTVWRLKEIVGAKLGLDPILVKLEKVGISTKEFKDSENSKRLSEMKIANGDKLNVTAKMSSSLIIKMNLLFSDQTLTPEAEQLFTEVFLNFTNEDGYMTRKTCTLFLRSCTSQMTDENDARIKRLFDNYDKDKDDLITLQDFKDFYRDSIVKKESTVWANIRSWDYRTDLRKGSERDKRSPKTLLRYILPRKRQYYDYFFRLLGEDYQIAE